VYAAAVEGRSLTFEAEAVWRRNMIMRDRETGTLWQHATGRAYIGPLQGNQLQVLGGEQTSWGNWRAAHPQSMVAQGPDRWPGLLSLPLTMKLLERATRSGWSPGLTLTDRRLPQNEPIIGLSMAGEARAYPLALLGQLGIVNDQVGPVPTAIIYRPDDDQVGVFRRPTDQPLALDEAGRLSDLEGRRCWDRRGRPVSGTDLVLESIPYQRQWWSGWYEFHPGTTLYAPES
jgi:hypothetical protein